MLKTSQKNRWFVYFFHIGEASQGSSLSGPLLTSKDVLNSQGWWLVRRWASHLITTSEQVESNDCVVPIAAGFRMVVLANRPGYPFLGNASWQASQGTGLVVSSFGGLSKGRVEWGGC